MRLVRIEIGRLPGVAPARRLVLDGLHPETNVLVGPNASGKSSVVRALRALLAPGSVPAHDVEVAATFEDEGRSWRVQRFGTTVAWRSDGVACEPPPLPDPSLLSCYAIGVEELMAIGDPDVAAAGLIAREMAGGYDLRRIREAPPFKVSGHRARTARTGFDRASRRHQQAEGEARALREDERRRARWERERDEASAARIDVLRLERARALADLVDDEARAAERAGTFPAGMERLVGNEAQRLAASRERTDAAKRERAAALARREAADRTIRDAGLDPAPPTAAELEERRAAVRSLERSEGEVAWLVRERSHARAERDRAVAALDRDGRRRGGWCRSGRSGARRAVRRSADAGRLGGRGAGGGGLLGCLVDGDAAHRGCAPRSAGSRAGRPRRRVARGLGRALRGPADRRARSAHRDAGAGGAAERRARPRERPPGRGRGGAARRRGQTTPRRRPGRVRARRAWRRPGPLAGPGVGAGRRHRAPGGAGRRARRRARP